MTIELYTDYECPACRNFFLNTLPELKKDFVATGKARLIHRDFRIPSAQIYEDSPRATRMRPDRSASMTSSRTRCSRPSPTGRRTGTWTELCRRCCRPRIWRRFARLVKNDAHLDDSVTRDEAMANSQDHLTQTPTIVIVVKGKRESIRPGRDVLPHPEAVSEPETRPMKRWLLLAGPPDHCRIFLYAGYEKAREPWIKFAVSVDEFKVVPDSWVQPIARILPWGEIALAIALITPILTRWFALIATLLLTLFLGVGIRAYALGLTVDCGCFGAGHSGGIDAAWFAEHVAMLALGLAVTIGAFLMARTRAHGLAGTRFESAYPVN